MIYTLYIWTVVALAGDHHGIGGRAYDWRPAGQYESTVEISGKAKCETAARELGLVEPNRYRCVRTK